MYRRKGKTKRDKLIRALDAITPKIVKLRDGYRCQRCGSMPKPQGCHWAHVYSRRSFILRWDLLNALALCHGCHSWFDGNGIDAEEWFGDKFPARLPYLKAKRAAPTGTIRTDYLEGLLEQHKQKYEELKGERYGTNRCR